MKQLNKFYSTKEEFVAAFGRGADVLLIKAKPNPNRSAPWEYGRLDVHGEIKQLAEDDELIAFRWKHSGVRVPYLGFLGLGSYEILNS